MSQELWFNLPVRSVAAARAFYTALGFRLSDRWTGDAMACLLFGDPPLVINLFPNEVFAGFAQAPVADTTVGCEVLISLRAETPEIVDAWTQRARDAGARILAEPGYKDGWMYGSAFQDVDGHRWNWLWCDPERMPRV